MAFAYPPPRRRGLPNNHHWTGRMLSAVVARRSQQQARQWVLPARAEHEQVGVAIPVDGVERGEHGASNPGLDRRDPHGLT